MEGGTSPSVLLFFLEAQFIIFSLIQMNNRDFLWRGILQHYQRVSNYRRSLWTIPLQVLHTLAGLTICYTNLV